MDARAVEDSFHAAQVPFCLLPDRGNEKQRSLCLDVVVDDHSNNLEHAGQCTGCVGNTGRKQSAVLAANRSVRSFPKAIIHMRADNADGTVRIRTFSAGDDVPDRINRCFQTVTVNLLSDHCGSGLLFHWRSRNFTNFDLFLDRKNFLRNGLLKGLFDNRVVEDALHHSGGSFFKEGCIFDGHSHGNSLAVSL